MALSKQLIKVPFSGLGTHGDPKTSPVGWLDLLENTQSLRVTEGGVEIEKRPGAPSLSRTVSGFLSVGAIARGTKVGALGNELIMLDGSVVYSRREGKAEWRAVGRHTDLAALVRRVAGNQGVGAIDTDCAYANGYLMLTFSRAVGAGGAAEWYLLDAATGAQVASGPISDPAYNVRVLATGTKFFIFSWDGVGGGGGGLWCDMIDTSGAFEFASSVQMVSDVDPAMGNYDVIYDSTGARLWLIYANNAGRMGIKPWTTGNASGGSALSYAAVSNPNAMGFLQHDFSNTRGYIGLVSGTNGVHLLRFVATPGSISVDVDNIVDGATLNASGITGYVVSGTFSRNVFYTPEATPFRNRRIAGWTDNGGGTAFVVRRSVNLASRAFQMQGRWYLGASYNSETADNPQNSLFLLELEPDAHGSMVGAMSVAGHLLRGNAAIAATYGYGKGLGGVAVISATVAAMSAGVAEQMQVPGASAVLSQNGLSSITLDWSGLLTGGLVEHNGVLYLPGACPKFYDGQDVVEAGPLLYPEKPTGVASNGGSLTALGTYRWTIVYERYDAAARLWESAGSFDLVVTLTGTQGTVTLTLATLRMTELGVAPPFNINPLATQYQIAVYRQGGNNGTNERLVGRVANNPAVDTVSFVDNVSDATVAANPAPYWTTGEVENASPPAVLTLEPHRDRIVAVTGDGAVCPSKDRQSGRAASFSDAEGYFVEFDENHRLVAAASDGTTLFVAERDRVYLIQGDGPLLDGSNGYTFPQPLPAQAGFRVPRGFVATPDGILVDTAKGKHMLDRAGGLQPVPGADAYDGLAVTGGLTLDDRTMALLTTSDGRTLCWDWQNKIWHTWTGQPAVACCRWQNKFVWLESDGKVHVETPGAYSDDGGAYAMALESTFVNLERARIYKALVHGEVAANCTLTGTLTVDWDASTAQAKSIVLTTAAADRGPWVFVPSAGRCKSVQLKLSESGTTAGVKLSMVGLEVGLKPGAAKYAAGKYMT